ncbi:MAG: hypothetical protein KC462_03765 [Cyanobacteria bacterium HKST-UBA05]|nr:hypothetical protein [Cyanobacteria bacterium HKST-UBA05]
MKVTLPPFSPVSPVSQKTAPTPAFGGYSAFAFPGTPASIYGPLEDRIDAVIAQSNGAVTRLSADQVDTFESAFNAMGQNWDKSDPTRVIYLKTPQSRSFNQWDNALRDAQGDSTQVVLFQVSDPPGDKTADIRRFPPRH